MLLWDQNFFLSALRSISCMSCQCRGSSLEQQTSCCDLCLSKTITTRRQRFLWSPYALLPHSSLCQSQARATSISHCFCESHPKCKRGHCKNLPASFHQGCWWLFPQRSCRGNGVRCKGCSVFFQVIGIDCRKQLRPYKAGRMSCNDKTE